MFNGPLRGPSAPVANPWHLSTPPRRRADDNRHIWWPGKEGAQGFANGRTAHPTPWPYITGFIRSLVPGRYGTATTLAAQGAQSNLWSGSPAFRPLGYEKPQTGPFSAY